MSSLTAANVLSLSNEIISPLLHGSGVVNSEKISARLLAEVRDASVAVAHVEANAK